MQISHRVSQKESWILLFKQSWLLRELNTFIFEYDYQSQDDTSGKAFYKRFSGFIDDNGYRMEFNASNVTHR